MLSKLLSRITARFRAKLPVGTPKKTARRSAGDRAEEFALELLKKRGHRLIERNVTYSCGEIDLITWHVDTLVFTEVRSRRSTEFGTPAESVSPAKQRRIRKAADRYLCSRYRDSRELPFCRFDVVWILTAGGQIQDSGVIEGAF